MGNKKIKAFKTLVQWDALGSHTFLAHSPFNAHIEEWSVFDHCQSSVSWVTECDKVFV